MSCFYAVAVGRTPGIYTSWDDALAQVDRHAGARFKKFKSAAEAAAFLTASSLEPPEHTTPCEGEHGADDIVCFTDGSCLGNEQVGVRRRAGYAVVFPYSPELTLSAAIAEGASTNNRAELTALLEALRTATKIDPDGARRMYVYSDSKVMIDSLTLWSGNWRKNNWMRPDGKPVANADLIKNIYDEIESSSTQRHVSFVHVRAHTNAIDWRSKWNREADRLARLAANSSG